ncbi:MAG: signal peptidase I, partial [Leuconostoc sp.]|nr:signal peptidase I [Leuconostoc sp.]
MIEKFHKKRKNKLEKKTNENTRKDGTKPSLTEDILNLVLKIFIIIALFWSLFVFVFGLHQVEETGMSPSIKPEDIIMYYRLDKDYDLLDPVVLKVNDTLQVRRVVAKAGDTVDITSKGLVVNGSLQTGLEKDFVNGDTLPY